MALVVIDESCFEDIADAIREKNGSEDTYKPREMAEAIEAISGGGITPTGAKSITANGTYDVTNYASAEVDVPQSGITPAGTKQITANGTGIDVAQYANADVNVPNTYAAGDEGKVVSNGALVSQTSQIITSPGTYDTTLVNSIEVQIDMWTEQTIATSGAVTQALSPFVFYHFTGTLTSLTITLTAPESGLAAYHFDFNSGSTAPTLNMPVTVVEPDSFQVDSSNHYEVDILNNYAVVQSWEISS